jgi:hypothetical protein|tara:strand:- start:28 stop:321 length:294 start_codon:yes stop_codon:yes gene_type:complete
MSEWNIARNPKDGEFVAGPATEKISVVPRDDYETVKSNCDTLQHYLVWAQKVMVRMGDKQTAMKDTNKFLMERNDELSRLVAGLVEQGMRAEAAQRD